MTDTTESSPSANASDLKIVAPERNLDLITIISLVMSLGLIVAAILIGSSNANFFNMPSVMIVVLGTIFVTSMSYGWDELSRIGGILSHTVFQTSYKPSLLAKQLLDMAVIARKNGLLALSSMEAQLKKDPFLNKAVQIVTDGYTGEDVSRVLGQETDSLSERHRRAASILRRGAEVAPAMGLIGTLVGLVQMLAQLQDPESIGPSMAVALLTTFYGAILGSVVLGPLAAKLERNSNQESLVRSLIMQAMISIASQDNPRRLEMLLNSELPPSERIRYFE